jgi:(1->4)-alpha-D-glucan 1-alpha-D-glucosylmutase
MPTAIPLATYRLQFSKDFGFDAAASIVPYLKSLGITHLYASPFLKARPGSGHGYDVTDHGALNPEFGGEAGFVRLSDALKAAGLGLILDFVPNHMAVGGASNAWWLDVLEWGRRSPRAASFDISWDVLPYRKQGGVLLPVLGEPYGEALRSGKIELKYDAAEGSFSAWYFEHRFPINPQRYSDVIRSTVAVAHAENEAAGRALLEIAADYAHPGAPSYRQAPELKRRLAEVTGADDVMMRGLVAYRPDHDAGLHALHRLLERQSYRLADWKLAVSGINYRRFFDINELAGLRVEDARTFADMHALVSRLIAEDRLQGIRLDHIDGLLDPQQYARRLQQLVRRSQSANRRPFYTVVEKILAAGEAMPPLAGVAGTTGYEWLNLISQVLMNSGGQEALDALWREIDPVNGRFAQVVENAKERILDSVMASEFNVLVQLLGRIAAGHYDTRDYASDRLRLALRFYVLEFPIYRTYVTAGGGCAEGDRAVIDRTIAAARARWRGTDADIFEFLRRALTLDLIDDGLPYSKSRARQFALKMQQFTGPMAAKSIEDTAFYRYGALLASNEVGGDPTLPGLSTAAFHERLVRHAASRPHGLTTTATHDAKRGEDARTRILALTECPALWQDNVARWRAMNAGHTIERGGRRMPSAAHEYMLYQTLVGAWPNDSIDDDFARRIEDYAIKAAREGKVETDWLGPDAAYEEALRNFVRTLLDPERSKDFLVSFRAFARRIALLGALNSLAQLVLKATMPGVPDFYQGAELWDLSLVDPDNRRPVDFCKRRAWAEAGPATEWRSLSERWRDGQIKFALTRRLLEIRSTWPDVFSDGNYEPVEVRGADSERVIAFSRQSGRNRILIAVGRNLSRLTGDGMQWPTQGWNATLHPAPCDGNVRFEDLFGNVGADLRTGSALDAAALFATMPVAMLRLAPA